MKNKKRDKKTGEKEMKKGRKNKKEIEELIRNGESKHLELKESLNLKDEIGDNVLASKMNSLYSDLGTNFTILLINNNKKSYSDSDISEDFIICFFNPIISKNTKSGETNLYPLCFNSLVKRNTFDLLKNENKILVSNINNIFYSCNLATLPFTSSENSLASLSESLDLEAIVSPISNNNSSSTSSCKALSIALLTNLSNSKFFETDNISLSNSSGTLMHISAMKNANNKDYLSFSSKKCYIKKWKYFYELSPDEKVMTLNSGTGEIELQKPTAYLTYDNDKIKEDMYKIETIDESGKEGDLVVSEKHKVYVSSEISNLSSYNVIKLPSKSLTSFNSSSNLENDDLANSILSCGILNQTTENILELVYCLEFMKSQSLVTNTLFSEFEKSASLPLSSPFDLRAISTFCSLRNLNNLWSTFSSNKNLTLERDIDNDIFFSSGNISRIFQCCDYMLFSQRRECFQNLLIRNSCSEHFQNLPEHNSSSIKSEFSMTDVAVCNNIGIDFNSHCENDNSEDYINFSNDKFIELCSAENNNKKLVSLMQDKESESSEEKNEATEDSQITRVQQTIDALTSDLNINNKNKMTEQSSANSENELVNNEKITELCSAEKLSNVMHDGKSGASVSESEDELTEGNKKINLSDFSLQKVSDVYDEFGKRNYIIVFNTREKSVDFSRFSQNLNKTEGFVIKDWVELNFDGRAVNRGGNWNNGANAGLFYANLNNAPSNTNTNIGFRCCSSFKCQTFYTERIKIPYFNIEEFLFPCISKSKQIMFFKTGIQRLGDFYGNKKQCNETTSIQIQAVFQLNIKYKTFAVSKRNLFLIENCKCCLLIMRKYKNLFEKVVSFENLYLAYQKARKGKNKRREVLQFNFELEKGLLGLQGELTNETYKIEKYRDFIIFEPKKREISALPFRDRVVQHAICNVIEPIFESTFIYDNYACRKNKGTHLGIKRLVLFLRNQSSESYALKCDIKKYFPSINHEILKKIIRNKIGNKKLLILIDKIIDSKKSFKGIPIGNLTSQLFANIYLNELDKFVKHELRAKYYLRYMDDFLILDNNKEILQEYKIKINDFLNSLELKMHEKKCIVFPCKNGVDFLGYVVFKNYKRARKSTVKRGLRNIKKKIRKYELGIISFEKLMESFNSWEAYLNQGNTYGLKKSLNEVYLKNIM